ncbi:MAG: rod shape-determining protein MreD [Bdellovibrionales bacterium]
MLPFSSISERFEDFARYIAAYGLVLIFFVSDVIAIPDPFNWIMSVPFLTMIVFYWSIHRPSIIPTFAAFILGLLLDILSGAPLGFNAMILLFLQWAMTDQRAFLSAQSFPMIWLIFSLVQTAIMILQWFVTGLLNFNWTALSELWSPLIIAIVTFPFIALILHFTLKILPNMKMSLSSRELQ